MGDGELWTDDGGRGARRRWGRERCGWVRGWVDGRWGVAELGDAGEKAGTGFVGVMGCLRYVAAEGRASARTLGRLVGLFFVFDLLDGMGLLLSQSPYECGHLCLSLILERMRQ